MIHLSSLGLVLILCGWAAMLDTEAVQASAPNLYLSTLVLSYLMLVTTIKDVIVQLVVLIQFRIRMQRTSLAFHL